MATRDLFPKRPPDSASPAHGLTGSPQHRSTAPPQHAFSLYVHIPYCDSKCPYCDFNSYAAKRWPEADYVAALIAELEHYAGQETWSRGVVQTIFFGGGTPSLFAPDSIAAILAAADRFWPAPFDGEREVTLEANPGTVSLDKLRGFKAAGVNRMSFGVQSFHARHLLRLGRIHDAEQAKDAIRLARAAEFDNVSLDLIFALPGQTPAEWEADLATAIALGPDHVSAYNLTYEESTPFEAMRRRGELKPLAEEIEVAMFTRTRELLAGAGYHPYEISNFVRPGRACRHNLNYWRGGDYLGVGAGAHSFSRAPLPSRRWSNEKLPARYIERAATSSGVARAFEETLTQEQARGEFVFLGLRCSDGFAAADFEDRFGADFLHVFEHAAFLARDGLLENVEQRWRLTPRGLLVADSIFATFT
jgi:oxygen-independent coproporphyrinogen-3 oxidase